MTNSSCKSNFLASYGARRTSLSRPTSKSKPRHVSPFLIPNIDTSAQYYRKPEARLKLRIFLASPQKFDEAVEFRIPNFGEWK
ncbi:hypothetical protein BDW60DRAFT_40519 [Aspergillus nidulans var. acristatus]